jgi:phospholipid/cholesterol/gamma-HCH transport system substrate-binding protein
MKKYTLETYVGIFVVIGLLCVAYLTVKLGKFEVLGGDYYILKARFASVSGLKPGSSVEMAGVQIGTVDRIRIHTELQVAEVAMKIRNDIMLSEDTIASIKTNGLIGDKYVRMTPGGSEEVLKDGDRVLETESAVDLEELISNYIFGKV